MTLRKYTGPIILGALLAGCWEIASRLGIINMSLFSAPTAIIENLIDLLLQNIGSQSILFGHMVATLKRLVLAFLVGSAAGFIVGTLLGFSRLCYYFFDPLLTVLMPIPGIAIAPIFIVILGFGDATIISVGSIAAFFPIAFNTASGIRSMDNKLVNAAGIMGASKVSTFINVYLPWSAIYLITGVKLSLAKCWRTVIAVEFVAAADWGIGYMIWDAAEYLNAAVVYGGIVLTALTFVMLENCIIQPVERYTIEKWGQIQGR